MKAFAHEASTTPTKQAAAAEAGLRSRSVPLDPGTAALFRTRLGFDFGAVRIHADDAAAHAARGAGAAAYTIGSDIVFGRGLYQPGTAAGRRLLAHELAHVAQHRLGGSPARELSSSDDPDEREAQRAADAHGAVALSPARARIHRVQLTYDDGPDNAGNTRSVLDALNAAGAHATFYLVGKRVAQGENWRIVFDIAAAGHWIGNHAFDWNDEKDNHIFLHGSVEERAEKILETEWAIRDALIRGRDDAKKRNGWDTIPAPSRAYIDDLIARGTGRFRTPGFKSNVTKSVLTGSDDATTMAAIESTSHVLAAAGLRPLAFTTVGTPSREGVDVDPKDWQAGKTQSDIESAVKSGVSSNTDSILLHSRIAATAAATPAILADLKSRTFTDKKLPATFDPTPQGALGSVLPKPGFAGLSTISDPPTAAELAAARAFLKSHMLAIGPFLSGAVALGIFQLAQRAGSAEVAAFAAEIKSTQVATSDGPVPLANWMLANKEWGLFAGFFENWATNQPFPRIKGVTQ